MGKAAAWIRTILILALGAVSASADCTHSPEPGPLHRHSAPILSPADTLPQWGYGYGDLNADLEAWAKSPHVKVKIMGATVQSRAIWSVNITEGADSVGKPGDPSWRKRRVFVHARTHPAEVQAHHVAAEMIRFLLDSGDLAREIRRDFIFTIVPMYNPDGVEMMRPRENANGVDIESNWNKPVLEPEVQSLKRHFEFLMAGPVPVEVALNLHSDQFNCTRFFFFHEAGGTSAAYVDQEKDFIGKVQRHFPSGIEDWSFVRSWSTATGTQYPEGFWWLNHREKVMALTYEDTNCPGAGDYDSTARALVLGAVDYLRPRVASLRPLARAETRLLREPGGWRVLDGEGRGFTAWSLRDAAGRMLGEGRFQREAAFIPGHLAAARTAVLLLSGPGNSAPSSLLIPAVTP